MALSQVRISVSDLMVGMYVSRLDRPWAETPFPIQGILLRDAEDIRRLRAFCRTVYIDTAKGLGPPDSPGIPSQGRKTLKPSEGSGSGPSGSQPEPLRIHHGVYNDYAVPLIQETPRAARIMTELRGRLLMTSKQLAKGAPINYDEFKQSVGGMVDSVLRCPDAFTWLLRLRGKDLHIHDHSLRAALLGVQFARYIGLPRDQIQTLCLGLLLKDVGKLRLPAELVQSPAQTPEQEQEYRKFIEYGVEMLRNNGNIEPRVISLVYAHCERHDGSGFPRGLAGGKIPLLARIAAVATAYDTISHPREAMEPMAPSRAVNTLYNLRDKAFPEDLVVHFIQSIGLYPTGTFVELTTGDVGVVVEQGLHSRLTPKVAVLRGELMNDTSGAKGEQQCFVLDLHDEASARSLLVQHGSPQAATVAKLAVARDLEPHGIDIDLSMLSPLLLSDPVQTARKRKGWLGFFSRA